MINKRTGSLTLLSLGFLLVISVILGYQMTIYHSQLMTNHILIQKYVEKRRPRSK